MHVNQSSFGAMAWMQRPHCGEGHHGHHRAAKSDDLVLAMRQRAMLSVSGKSAGEGPEAAAGIETQTSVTAMQRMMVSGSAPAADTNADAPTYDAALMRKQKASLSICTQEGDSVAIRFRSRDAIAVQASAPVGESADAAGASDLRLYSFAAGRVEIAVQGQLDEGEMQAIGDLVQQVDALASQFFGGDMEAAFSAAADLGFDGSEIASFSLRMSVKESLRASMSPVQPAPQVEAAPAAGATTEPAAAPVATAASEEPVAPAVAEAAEPVAVEVPEGTSPAAEEVPAETSSDVPSLQQILGSYLQQVMGSLAQLESPGRVEFSMSWKMRLMVSALETPPQQQEAPSAGAALLGDSLQSAAAAQA